jgi:glycosyltransferase involved in cell wall biosynthesis
VRIAIDIRHIRDLGIGTYIRNLVEALAAHHEGHSFHLIGRVADQATLVNMPAHFERVLVTDSDGSLRNQLRFPALIRRLNPDVTHIPLNAAPLFAPRPYVVTIHDMSSLLFPGESDPDLPSLRRNFRLMRFRRSLLRAERIVAVSLSTRRDVENLLNIPADRIRQIYSAPDPGLLTAPASRESLERYGINFPYILYVGSMRPWKNVPRIVEAFAFLRSELDEHPHLRDMRLVLIGDQISRHPEIRRMVNRTHMQQHVRFFGYVPLDTLRAFYSNAAVFAFPSLYEGFGLPPLEAMACGAPVVASNVSSLPEVVGDAANLVNPDNVFDIARGVREVLLNDDLRERLIARGRRRVARFDWKQTAQEMLRVYREAAGR